MDTILVYAIVLAAALFLARWFYKNLISQNKKPACGSCDSCPPAEDAEPEKTHNASTS